MLSVLGAQEVYVSVESCGKQRSPKTNLGTSKCHQLQRRLLVKELPAQVLAFHNLSQKQKGLGYKPSPSYYQTVVAKVSHRFPITRSNENEKKSRPISRIADVFQCPAWQHALWS